jgi:solute carrier family 25 2-oxodicarboxylate transporter 21
MELELIAGVTELLMLYPLDVIKTRQQLDTSKNAPGMVTTFKNIVKQEG